MAKKRTTQEKQHEISTVSGCLPEELMIEILLRLPITSLGRFKSMHKSWNCLISTHTFAKSHFNFSATRTGNPVGLSSPLFLSIRTGRLFSVNLNDRQENYLESTTIKGRLIPSKFRTFHHHLGSCLGLMCIMASGTFSIYVLNPITQECRNVQYPPVYSQSYDLMGCGFGFASWIHDCKLVLLGRISLYGSHNYLVHVFSLRDDQWKQLDVLSSGLDTSVSCHNFMIHGHPAVWLNEALYWVTWDPFNHSADLVIIKFDLIKEKFARISSLKLSSHGCYSASASIGLIYDNNLCVCQLHTQGQNGVSLVEVWMSEEEYDDWKVLFRVKSQIEMPLLTDLLGFTLSDNALMMIIGYVREILIIDQNQQDPPVSTIALEECASYVPRLVASLISPFMLYD